jgi:hypothetical protein
MIIISRQFAQQRGLTRFFTGKPCPRHHIAERFTANGNCVDCVRLATRKITATEHECLLSIAVAARTYYFMSPEADGNCDLYYWADYWLDLYAVTAPTIAG